MNILDPGKYKVSATFGWYDGPIDGIFKNNNTYYYYDREFCDIKDDLLSTYKIYKIEKHVFDELSDIYSKKRELFIQGHLYYPDDDHIDLVLELRNRTKSIIKTSVKSEYICTRHGSFITSRLVNGEAFYAEVDSVEWS